MKTILIRHLILQALLLAACFGSIGSLMFTARHTVDNANSWVRDTQIVISRVETVDKLLERMLADQRGYQLSGNTALRKNYEHSRDQIVTLAKELGTLTSDNQIQADRVASFITHFAKFKKILDNKNRQYSLSSRDERHDDSAAIGSLKDNLILINDNILDEEYRLLNLRLQNVQRQRNGYFAALLMGCALSAFLLFVFNSMMFMAQQGRARAERQLRESEAAFRLAVEGAQDGIFDWDLETGQVVYTKQFWSMLGYEADEFPETADSFLDLIHPEDRLALEIEMRREKAVRAPGYAVVIRMKRRNGRWMWISSRGRILYDDQGNAVRIAGAHTDITGTKAYEKRLERARDRAEKASRAKSEFLAHMSHEIRTPLTAISGIAEIFERNQKNLDEKQKLLIKTLRSSSSLLSELISDILDFSRIESGELRLEDRSFDLAALFDDVIGITAIAAREKNLEFSFDYSAVEGTQFMGDKTRLRQILINLIGNAVKFTSEGSVNIRAVREDGQDAEKLRIDVADTGIGIDPAKFDMVFEQFRQGDSSVSRKYGGTGLGLAISLRLAQMMSGTIRLDSVPGKGATFSLILPFRTGEANPGDSDARRGMLMERMRAAAPDEKRVLLAEDYEGNVVMLGYILDSLDCPYDVARNGREAVALWEKNRYDLVLMDVQMPEMDGLTATAAIRKREKERGQAPVPIIGMTAHVRMEDKEKCIEAGMDVYLPKPVVEADLKACIAECLTQDSIAA